MLTVLFSHAISLSLYGKNRVLKFQHSIFTACCLPKCMYSRKKIKLRASRFWCMQYAFEWITQSKIECNWVPKNHRGTKWWPARRAATVKVLICKRARARLPKACLLTSRRASALFGVPIWSHAVAIWTEIAMFLIKSWTVQYLLPGTLKCLFHVFF